MDTESESTGEFNLQEAANEIIGETDSSSDSTEDSSQLEGQSEQDSQETNENKELSPEEILKQVGEEKESPEQFAEILKAVNGLGLMGNGMPVNIESPEQLKKLIEMGAGFYAKTEEHANNVKAKEAEFIQKETQFKELEERIATERQENEQVFLSNQIMGSIVQRLQTEDLELWTYLDDLYRKEEGQHLAHKPFQQKFESELKARDERINSLAEKIETKEKTELRQGFETGLSELQTKVAASLSKLGVKGDWTKVQEAWASDASNTMTVEQAFYAVHGKDIAKANESHQKLLATKTKTQAKLLGRTGIGGGQRGQEETIKAPVGDYESIIRQASATM